MPNIQVSCALCGASVGLGIPGSSKWCSECGQYVVAQEKQGNIGNAIGGLLTVGLVIVATVAGAAILKSIFKKQRM